MPHSALATQKSQFLNQTDVEKILRKLETFPTLPTIVYELNRIISNPLSSAQNVALVMQKDQSMAAKSLKLVNSAYYGIPGGIADLQRAISYLGFDIINQVVLTASVFDNLNKKSSSQFNLPDLWKHALGVAMAAETIAKWTKFYSPQNCFSSGLLHDLGKLALYTVAPEKFDEITSIAAQNQKSFFDTEVQIKMIPHSHLGAILAAQWKLPPVIEMSILYHHEMDPKNRNILKPEVNQVVDIVCLSNILIHHLNFGNSGHQQQAQIDPNLLKRVNLQVLQLPLILKDITRSLETVDDFVKLISG